jgi:hypothetical protein
MQSPQKGASVANVQTAVPRRKMSSPNGYVQIDLLWATRVALTYTSAAEAKMLKDKRRR